MPAFRQDQLHRWSGSPPLLWHVPRRQAASAQIINRTPEKQADNLELSDSERNLASKANLYLIIIFMWNHCGCGFSYIIFQHLTQVVRFASHSVEPTFRATGAASAASAPGPVVRQNAWEHQYLSYSERAKTFQTHLNPFDDVDRCREHFTFKSFKKIHISIYVIKNIKISNTYHIWIGLKENLQKTSDNHVVSLFLGGSGPSKLSLEPIPWDLESSWQARLGLHDRLLWPTRLEPGSVSCRCGANVGI